MDVVNQIVPQGAEAVLNNAHYHVWSCTSSQHRELSMRNDKTPWNEQAGAPGHGAHPRTARQIAQALFKGYAQLGNDNPFAPIFRSTDKRVPQRKQDIDQGQAAASEAGHPNGFTTTCTPRTTRRCRDLAQIVKQAACQVGITINLHVENQAKYYGDTYYGKSDWLTAR